MRQGDKRISPSDNSNRAGLTSADSSTASHVDDLGKTASMIAHGVRNPLNALKGAIVFLSARYGDDPDLQVFSRIIQEEIERFDDFISTFLSTSISEAPAVPTDINLLLRNIQILTSFQMQSNHIRADFRFGDVPLVSVNPFHLEHAILNVINNAVEAIRSEGEIFITSKLETCSGRDLVVIEISDNGPGMWKKKGRGCPAASGQSKGFGLFITREILRYYGGYLEIQSSRGKGTEVRLYLSAGGGRIK